jgi:hypothetical protein
VSEAFKTCSCGRSYTQDEWEQLPNRKLWELPWGEVLEMRDCVCRSTISIVLAPGKPEEGMEGVKKAWLSKVPVSVPAWIKRKG